MSDSTPRIGVAVIVMREHTVLLGKRLSSHGEGCWQFPGGHLEFGESVVECAQREVSEETGLEVGNLKTGSYTNDIFSDEQKHYVTLYVIADHVSGEAIVREPEKCETWQWFDWNELPSPLFLPIKNFIKQNAELFG